MAVGNALSLGKLQRGPCEQADDSCSGPIQAHHDDYSKPLVVRWLCRSHHGRAHRGTSRRRCDGCQRVISQRVVGNFCNAECEALRDADMAFQREFAQRIARDGAAAAWAWVNSPEAA